MGSWFKKHISQPAKQAIRNPIRTLGIIATAPISVPILTASSIASHYGQDRVGDYLKVLSPGTVLSINNPKLRQEAELGYATAATIAVGAAGLTGAAATVQGKAQSALINSDIAASGILPGSGGSDHALSTSPGYATVPSFDQGNPMIQGSPTYNYMTAPGAPDQASIFGNNSTTLLVVSAMAFILFGILGSRKG